jgi:hypothetical protein
MWNVSETTEGRIRELATRKEGSRRSREVYNAIVDLLLVNRF